MKNLDNGLSQKLNNIINSKSVKRVDPEINLVMPKDIVCAIFDESTDKINSIVKFFDIEKNIFFKELNDITISDTKVLRKTKNESTGSIKRVRDISTDIILQLSDRTVSKFQHPYIDIEHVIYSFLVYGGKNQHIKAVKNIFEKFGMSDRSFRKKFIMTNTTNIDRKVEESIKKEESITYEKVRQSLISDGFIESINERVKRLNENIIGRDIEIDRCIQILCRKKKKNTLIIGESGIGKTSLVDGIALRINENSVPDKIKGVEIFSLNISNVVAGTKYRGQFEDRMKNIINFFDYSQFGKKSIIFIDEMHTIMNAGATEGSVNASNMLKPKLTTGDIQCIGSTTTTEFKKNISGDDAMVRRFSILNLEEPNINSTINILKKIKKEYEEHYSVNIDIDILDEIVYLSDIYIKNRKFPDKAIDILDESCSKASIVGKNKIDIDIIREIVSEMSNVPVTNMLASEKEVLLQIENNIKKEVVGQDACVDQVCSSIKRSRIGLKDENKPIGVFLFVGSSGCGKTLLSKTISKNLFGKDKVIRLDMSEFMERHSISKIIGSPSGYVGYEDGSAFIDNIRQKPYSVILLDEIEKAHKDVLNVFLQIFDEGRLTDSFGRFVDFRNTIIIMTSNIASSEKSSKMIGFGFNNNIKKDDSKLKEEYIKSKVNMYFSPEFLNRIDDIIVFNPIDRELAKDVFAIEFSKTLGKIKKIGYDIKISQAAIDFVCENGYDEKYGARPMVRSIQKLIEKPITDIILKNNNEEFNCIDIDKNNDGLNIKAIKK